MMQKFNRLLNHVNVIRRISSRLSSSMNTLISLDVQLRRERDLQTVLENVIDPASEKSIVSSGVLQVFIDDLLNVYNVLNRTLGACKF